MNISAGPTTQFEDQGGGEHASIAGDGVQAVVADLGQDRVHHHEQTEGNRQRRPVDFDGTQGGTEAGDEPPQDEIGGHRRRDPQWQVPIQRGQLRCEGTVDVGVSDHLVCLLGCRDAQRVRSPLISSRSGTRPLLTTCSPMTSPGVDMNPYAAMSGKAAAFSMVASTPS